jgi:hypothetical protein
MVASEKVDTPSVNENPHIANAIFGGTVSLPCLKQYVETAMQWISAPSSSCVRRTGLEAASGVSLVSTREASREARLTFVMLAGSPGVEGSVTSGVDGVVIDGIVGVTVPLVLEVLEEVPDLDFCFGWDTNFATI